MTASRRSCSTLYAETFGDAVRANTMVLVDEVADGGWGIRGEVLTLAKLQDDSQN
jgi:4-oxalocrotonate tautomerase